MCKIYHNLKIEPFGISLEVEHGTYLSEILRSYKIEFPCGGKGICGNCKVRVLSGMVRKTNFHKELLDRKKLSDDWCLACYVIIEDNLTIEIPQGVMSVQTDMSDIKVDEKENGYGVAVDLGSTTIVVQLVNLEKGKVIATRVGLNPQSVYGADIISRISYSINSTECSRRLTYDVRNYIETEIKSIINDFPDISINKVRIVGNSVMHHLFIGHDVSCFASAPFQSEHNSNCCFTPSQLGWSLQDDCIIEFLPNISHFVGSDILAGVMSSGMFESKRYSLLLDLGTNGELVLGNNEKMWCTSTAAGPAFEGVNISCGMRASSGAISEVEYKDGKFQVSTINNTKPIGLCGSGLVEAIYSLLENEMIDCMGTVIDDNIDSFELADGVSLTINDIREFQLAKAAIAAGIQLLIKYSSVTVDDISDVYITGGLGNYVNFEKISRLGLIPGVSSSKYRRIDNAALAGCKKILYNSEYNKIDDILKKIEYCPLESDVDFMDLYCNNMYFNLEPEK